jgi:hypothetical protein
MGDVLILGLCSGGLLAYGFMRRLETKRVRNDKIRGVYGEPTYDTIPDDAAKRDGNAAICAGLLCLVYAARIVF